ncbi:hypothetical protein BD410DRAFT_727920 [Rickenella mellea]|uniref:CHAT domain-containing protein n=1 Tax=Rickenella mellea TaxID=50990 RepID=A0A4Y7PUV9_9AGAM|nr:hypothetical protein BD410DRAFT_727920 [Rickenella mellea]
MSGGLRNDSTLLQNLGVHLFERFTEHSDELDMDHAISSIQRAIELTPDGHPDKRILFSNLGAAFSQRFDLLGDLADLDQGILYNKYAVQLTPDSDPDKPGHLCNLGTSYWQRFARLGEMADIEHSLLNHERAIQFAPKSHPSEATYYHNIANSFAARFSRLGKWVDIEQAVLNQERAVRLTPDGDPKKHIRFGNLGHFILKRFRRLGDMEDIKQAILSLELAIQLTPENHRDKPDYLNDLGCAFSGRFQRLGDMSDIERAILYHEQAVQLTPDSHKKKSRLLGSLGTSLALRLFRTGNEEDLVKCVAAYRTAAQLPSSPPSIRLHHAQQWSLFARGEIRCHPSDPPILDAYRVAFDLLPRVAWVGLSINSRYHELLDIRSLGCDATAAAISENNLQLALEWMEQGRSIVWGHILQLRSPVDDLCRDHPKIAKELTQISNELERGASGDHFTTGKYNESCEGAVQRHQQLARDWELTVEQVRQTSGFERFLLPKQFSELRQAAHDGPIVVLNASIFGCDALIIERGSENIHHVRLGSFSYGKAKALQELIHAILSQNRLRNRYDDRHAGPEPSESFQGDDVFRPILEELWKSVVKPVLDRIQIIRTRPPTHEECFRIQWCPTGPLAFLPIHAAGIYNADGTSSISLPDIAISSYTPSLTALLNTTQRITNETTPFKLLAVIQPDAPGAPRLPGTLEELKIIRKHVSDSSVHVLEGQRATIEEVSSGMEEFSWVHLACHGVQDTSHPMESGLLLHDGRLHLSKIIQKRLTHAEFAFLSACQTATGDQSRPDEAIHLAAGMLLAGYRGVVATMWSIRDDDAPFVADNFYGRLLENGLPNRAKAAEALHFAVHELREKSGGCKFSSWVPFIYMGV